MGRPLMERLVYARTHPVYGRLIREFLLLYGLDIPTEVKVGPGLILQHRALGTVIHPATVIEEGVTLYHQVTIGRRDAHVPARLSPMKRIEIGAGAILYPGAKILGGAGTTRIGRKAIIAANAVVTTSVPDGEIWGGVPARMIGTRPDRKSEIF